MLLEERVSKSTFEVLDLELRPYAEVWDLQKQLVNERLAGGTDKLLLVEHPEVVTLGREHKGPPPDCGLPVYEVERGGRETYHGPGQLVGYPIVRLADRGLDLDAYLRALEEALIEAVAPWCEARTIRGFTGVWVGRRKLASIGITVREGVTFHGFALNVSTELSRFALIHPCGLEPRTMTSLTEQAGRWVAYSEVRPRLLAALERTLASRFAAA